MFFPPGRRLIALAAVAAAVVTTPAVRTLAAEPVMVFAAVTLKDALDAVDTAAQATAHIRITVVYGPTPSLVKQLRNGAPADIFFSADAEWMAVAVARKLVDPATRVDLLSSRLVLIAPAPVGEAKPITPDLPLTKMLGDGRLAMCDPMMMPAGRDGRAALQKLGLWASVKDHVATAVDVRVALNYVGRRETPLGIVFDTDARLDKDVGIVGVFPPSSYPPIAYPLAAVAKSRNPDTKRALDFLTSAAARRIYARYGYTLLPERQ